MQGSGNLVLLNAAGAILFSSETIGSTGFSFYLRADGNLLLVASTGAVIWQTGKRNAAYAPYLLAIGDDGTVQIRGTNAYILWIHSQGGYKVWLLLFPVAIQGIDMKRRPQLFRVH